MLMAISYQLNNNFKLYNMKRNLLILTIFIIASFSKLNAQNLKNDNQFLKSTALMYATIDLFNNVYKSDDRNDAKNENISLIQTNTNKISNFYNSLKVNFTNDTDFKEYELWVQTITKSTEMLKNDDDTWMLGFTLIKMNINDFVNSKY